MSHMMKDLSRTLYTEFMARLGILWMATDEMSTCPFSAFSVKICMLEVRSMSGIFSCAFDSVSAKLAIAALFRCFRFLEVLARPPTPMSVVSTVSWVASLLICTATSYSFDLRAPSSLALSPASVDAAYAYY